MLMQIIWDVSPEIIPGWRTPNFYGLLFITGIILGYRNIKKVFAKEQIPEKILDSLLVYVVIATIVGARLGHVFFYDWDDYKNDLPSIFKVWEGGLASHGAAVAILIALFVFSKKVSKKP
jgi:prolipoprotein diacylglyceryltransferase